MKKILKKIKEVFFKKETPQLIEKESAKIKRTKKENRILNVLIEKYKNDIYRKDGNGYKLTTIKKISEAVGLNVEIRKDSYDGLYINYTPIDFGGFRKEREIEYIFEMCLYEKKLLLEQKKERNMISHEKRLETRRKNSTRKVLFEKTKAK